MKPGDLVEYIPWIQGFPIPNASSKALLLELCPHPADNAGASLRAKILFGDGSVAYASSHSLQKAGQGSVSVTTAPTHVAAAWRGGYVVRAGNIRRAVPFDPSKAPDRNVQPGDLVEYDDGLQALIKPSEQFFVLSIAPLSYVVLDKDGKQHVVFREESCLAPVKAPTP